MLWNKSLTNTCWFIPITAHRHSIVPNLIEKHISKGGKLYIQKWKILWKFIRNNVKFLPRLTPIFLNVKQTKEHSHNFLQQNIQLCLKRNFKKSCWPIISIWSRINPYDTDKKLFKISVKNPEIASKSKMILIWNQKNIITKINFRSM